MVDRDGVWDVALDTALSQPAFTLDDLPFDEDNYGDVRSVLDEMEDLGWLESEKSVWEVGDKLSERHKSP